MRQGARVLSPFQDVPAVPAQVRAARSTARCGQGKLVDIMAQTDPIAELLTRIRNAAHARHQELELTWSRLREAIARVLVAEGFLDNVEVAGEGVKKTIKIRVRYSSGNEPVMQGIERVSRPSIRRYRGAAELGRISRGMGIEVVTTPLGVMTGREARRKKVGGEVLLRVW